MADYRIYLAVRLDVKAPAAKWLIQAGHAFSECLRVAREQAPDRYRSYYEGRITKIAVGVRDEEALRRVSRECNHLPQFVVTDLGLTIFETPTVTCMAVGPCERDELSNYVRRLRLLSPEWPN